MSHIMAEPGRHGWADLLMLVGSIRRVAFDRSFAEDRRGLPGRCAGPEWHGQDNPDEADSTRPMTPTRTAQIERSAGPSQWPRSHGDRGVACGNSDADVSP